MAKSRVVLIGTTGYVGTATVKVLASQYESSADVVAVTRDPATAASKGIAGPNVSVVAGGLDDPKGLVPTLQNATSAFVITPGHIDRTQLAINGVNAAKEAGVPHIVVISVSTSGINDTIFGRQFDELEKHVKATGVSYTLLRLPLFIDNNWANVKSIKENSAIYGPADPDKKFTPIAVQDVAEAAAKILVSPADHKNQTYDLRAPAFSHTELAAAFSKALGKEVKYVQVPFEAAKQAFLSLGFPEWQTDGVMELYKLINSGSAVTNGAHSDVEKIIGRPATTIEAWTEQVKGGFQ